MNQRDQNQEPNKLTRGQHRNFTRMFRRWVSNAGQRSLSAAGRKGR
jgi:hypothetical protein